MNGGVPLPDEGNRFLCEHAEVMLRSLKRWTGRSLIDDDVSAEERAKSLFYAPFALVSHDTAADPVFNYANQTALTLFEMTWEQFTSLHSRLSAEPMHRDDRARLMAQVTAHGYIDDYRGIRISSCGRRFWIEQATVWNLMDAEDRLCGQAAVFRNWTFLE